MSVYSAAKTGFPASIKGNIFSIQLKVVGILGDGKVKERERIFDHIRGVLETDGKTTSMGFFCQEMGIGQLVSVGERETGVVIVDLNIIGFDAVETFLPANIQVGLA